MSVPFVPHAFVDGDNLDLEKLNDNLEAIARQVQRNFDARYTYSTLRLDLTGVVTADNAVLRSIAIRRPGTDNALTVCGVELVLYGNVAGTATVTCSDTTWPTLSVATSATTTVECTGSSDLPVPIPSSSADVTFTVALPAVYTVTAGELIVHLRCDRGSQGAAYTTSIPALLSSATAAPATALDTALAALGTSVGYDTAADKDIRVECFTVRSFTAATSVRLPSGARRLLGIVAYLVAPVGADMDVAVSGSGLTGISTTVTAAGATTRVAATVAATGTVTATNDPMDATDDTTVTLTRNGAGTISLGYVLVFWS